MSGEKKDLVQDAVNSEGIPEEVPAPPQTEEPEASAGDINEEELKEKFKKILDGEATFQDLFELSDEVLLTWAQYGYNLYNQGKYDEAETIFRGLVALNPNVSYYHTALGAVLEAQEKYDDAVEVFNKALELDSNDICALANRGEIYLRQGKIEQAAEDFRRAIELDEKRIKEAMEKGEKVEADPAAQRARALAKVTYEVFKEVEKKFREAQEKGQLNAEEGN